MSDINESLPENIYSESNWASIDQMFSSDDTFIYYRNYLKRSENTVIIDTYKVYSYSPSLQDTLKALSEPIANSNTFIKWLGDWQCHRIYK